MNIEVIFRYIYVRRFSGVAKGNKAKRKCKPGEEHQMNMLESMLGSMANRVRGVKGDNLQKMIKSSIADLQRAAEQGHVGWAMGQAQGLQDTLDKAINITGNMDKNLGKAKSLLSSLPPHARAAMAMIIDGAEKALNDATDPGALTNIDADLARAVTVATKIAKAGKKGNQMTAELQELGVIATRTGMLGLDHLKFSDGALKGRQALDGDIAKPDLNKIKVDDAELDQPEAKAKKAGGAQTSTLVKELD